MTQAEYHQKCVEMADKLGCKITIEEQDVYLEAEDVKSHFLKLEAKSAKWCRIYSELAKWHEGCNLIQPVKIS